MPYIAIKLDRESRAKLFYLAGCHARREFVRDALRCDHMTLRYWEGDTPPDDEHFRSLMALEGKAFDIIVQSYAQDKRVSAFGVIDPTGLCQGAKPHITAALHQAAGGESAMSSNLTDWQLLEESVVVQGVVTLVP